MDTKHPTDHTEENPELTEQRSDVTASEDFFQHGISGLYITAPPEDPSGQTTVIKHDKHTGDAYLVWDSSWTSTQHVLGETEKPAFSSSVLSSGAIIATDELDQTITIIRSVPDDSVHEYDRFIQEYARVNDPAKVSPAVFQNPIPPRPVDKKREEEDDGDAAIASAPAITARVDTNDPLFLHVHEHHTSHAILTLDEETAILDISPTKGNSNWKAIHLRGMGGRNPIVIKCYPFKEGLTLRFVDCGYHTITGPKDDQTWHEYKEYHVHLPQDLWYAGFANEVMTGRERRSYGPHNPQQAEYNAGVFPRFMDALERIVGVENMKKCKKVEDELVDDDAEEEDSDGDVE
ncbi:hypothetical protein J4E81_001769 [Alternaria sp. BMP 2799]|nr:hypothetical protein J4E81_001769 [Alternaria sp. BMP 2799]